MFKIIFMDGSIVSYNSAVEQEEFYNGSSRRTLTFEMNKDAVSIDALNALCYEDNVKELKLLNELEGIVNLYEGYVLKLELGLKSKAIDPEKGMYDDVLILKLGKRTYIEQMLHDMGVN